MHRCSLWLLVFLLSTRAIGVFAQTDPHLNISFTENKGQWNKNILYKAELPQGALFLENHALTYTFLDATALDNLLSFKYKTQNAPTAEVPAGLVDAHAYRVEFLNASTNPICKSEQAFPDYKNYYKGKDARHWTSGVKHFRAVTYNNIYPGTQLALAQEDGKMKYTFFLEAGINPEQIKLQYKGDVSLSIHRGNLRIKTSVNEIEEQKPVAWQTGPGGEKRELKCKYSLRNNILGFSFPDGIDPTLPLVIDPVLIFSSYSGSTSDNWGYTATYDKAGYLYAGGIAFSIGYPVTLGAYQVNYADSCDIAISKFDTTGSFLIYSTYLGGTKAEVPNSLVVDNSNNLFVLACTGSLDFPTTAGCYDNTFNGGNNYILDWIINYRFGSDLGIAKFTSDGTTMLASTFFGGSGNEGLNFTPPLKKNYADDARGEIKVNENGDIFVASTTSSSDLPVSFNAAQTTYGGVQDGFVLKMNGSLSTRIWATYLGGSDADAAYNLALPADGRVYVGGGTKSLNFPTTSGSIQPVSAGGPSDGFISCISNQGNAILQSTYYGAGGYDQIYLIDIDKQENVYAFGQTDATGFTFIDNATWYMPGGGQFVTKFPSDLSSRTWSTTFGTGNGGPDISPTAFMVEYCHNIYISGWGSPGLNGFGGTSGLPISADAFQSTTDGSDYYFLVFDGDAANLVYGTFFGGTSAEHVDGGTSRFDKKGRIYQAVCAGCGGSDSFPTTIGAWSNLNGSANCNIGVIKFDFKIPLVVADFIQPPAICTLDSVTFQNTSIYLQNNSTFMQWDFGDGGTSTALNPKHVYMQSGIYTVSLIINDTASCNLNDTAFLSIFVLADSTRSIPAKEICIGSDIQIGVAPIADPSVTYHWIPSTGLSNANIPDPFASPLATTTYKLLISNGLCTDTLLQPVKVWDLNPDAGPDTVICAASYLLKGTTPEKDVQFQWSSNAQFSDTLNTSPDDSTALVTLSNQTNWFYLKVYTDLCSKIDSINISFSILLSPTIGQNPSCPEVCDGSGWVTVTQGIPNLHYLWSNGSTNDSIFNLCDGTYTVSVSDDASCISIASFTLTDPEALDVAANPTPLPCPEICKGEISLITTGGVPPYTFLWSNGENTDVLQNLCAGTYFVTVTDDRGCKTLVSSLVDIDPFLVNITAGSLEDTLFQGQSTQIFATELSGCIYQWTPANSLTDPGSPTTTATPLVSTQYILRITDASGCQYEDSVMIIVKEVKCREPYIFVPNAFTPNADNNNDLVFVRGEFLESVQFSIFDRWGEKVFETNDINKGWNGYYRSVICEPGVYVYSLVATCFDKTVFKKKGNITLIR